MPVNWVSKRAYPKPETPKSKQPTGPKNIEDTPDLERYLVGPTSNMPSAPSKSLYCGICADVFKRPMRAPCGHSFCQRCISTWLSMNKSCPQDRRPLAPSQLHHDFIVESLVSELPAVCPFHDQGCRLGTQPLSQIRQHAVQCDFNPANIPDFIREVVVTSGLPVVLSDDDAPENRSPSLVSTPVATSSSASGIRRSIAAAGSPEEEPAPSNSGRLPLRLRLLRSGQASVDQLRDVVGGSTR